MARDKSTTEIGAIVMNPYGYILKNTANLNISTLYKASDGGRDRQIKEHKAFGNQKTEVR